MANTTFDWIYICKDKFTCYVKIEVTLCLNRLMESAITSVKLGGNL
jgi:hypothetical protein